MIGCSYRDNLPADPVVEVRQAWHDSEGEGKGQVGKDVLVFFLLDSTLRQKFRYVSADRNYVEVFIRRGGDVICLSLLRFFSPFLPLLFPSPSFLLLYLTTYPFPFLRLLSPSLPSPFPSPWFLFLLYLPTYLPLSLSFPTYLPLSLSLPIPLPPPPSHCITTLA